MTPPDQNSASPAADSPDHKTASGPPSRVFVVDDHTMFREGLRQLIDRDPGLSVCGDAADIAGALTGLRETKPDVVLVDISLTGASGIDLIKAIKSEYEDLPVLVVSMHDESLYAERALRAGAMGYVMKHQPAKTMKAAIAERRNVSQRKNGQQRHQPLHAR
jgi:DNA-binding NarL/FixJ family response regulator